MDNYVFELSYSRRTMEKSFIKDVIKNFSDELSMIALAINNNIYNLELLLLLEFEESNNGFEEWLQANYPEYLNRRKYNYYLRDVIHSIGTKGYNLTEIVDCDDVDEFITNHANSVFRHPEENLASQIWKGGLKKNQKHVFLCHSSKDKNIVDIIHNELQKREIETFYDKFGIKIGDNIRSVINQNLLDTRVGMIAVSKNFNVYTSGWIEDEVNYFKQKGITILPISIDVDEEKMKSICGDIRFVNWNNGIEEIVKRLEELFR